MSKTILITGASSGIGKATARALTKEGHKVYGAARQLDKMQDLKEAGIEVIALDVSDDSSIISAVEHIAGKDGGIDILINNAGYGEYGAIEDVPLKKAHYQLEVNLFGAVRLIQLVLPHMRKNGWGKIVNVTSIGGKIANPFGGWYHASKFALEGLSDSLRREVKPFGVDVIVVEPGAIKTEWGNIAVDNMMKSAKGSPYEGAARKAFNGLKNSADAGSAPEVIADLIQEALNADVPKTRYYGGSFAEQILTARKTMSDEEFDAMMEQMIS